MNRKYRVMVGLLGMLLFLMVFNVPALTQEYCFRTVADIVGSSNTETGNPAIHLIDEDPGSFWKLSPGSAEGWVELRLSDQTLIHGLKISGGLASDTELSLEYLQGEKWTGFLAGSYKVIPMNGVIDLSYDRAVTEGLRVRLTGTGAAYTQLSEIKVIGEAADGVFHQINPKTISASGHTSYLTREEFLNDGNTYTYWMVKPRYRSGNNWLFETIEGYLGIKPDYNYDFNWPGYPSYYNRGEVIFEMVTAEKISNINIFFTEDTRGDLTIESQENGVWKKIGFIPQRNQPGWHRTALEPAVVSSKIRLVMEATGHESVGGISEVQFWGYGNYQGDRHIDLGLQTSQSLRTAINRQFKLKKEDLFNHSINLSVCGDVSNQSIQIDLNGTEYAAVKSAEINGHGIYSINLTEEMLDNECNYLRIKPMGGFLEGLKLTSGRDGAQNHQATELNDGLLLNSGKNVSEQIIVLNQKVMVEQVEIYTTDTAILYLSYWDGARWVQVGYQPEINSGWVQFKTVFTTDQIKITNPSQIGLAEIKVLGSPITDRAPEVRLIRPEDYEVFDTDQLSDKHLIGFVDNPRARVKVNGRDPFQVGHYFGFHLTAVGASTWENTTVEAVATDPQGRTGRYQTQMIIDKLPWLILDQPEKIIFTGGANYQVSGEVKKSNCAVKVNGQTVIDKTGRFTSSVRLQEGFNLIKIECVYTKPGSGGNVFAQTFYRKAVRYSGQVELRISSPLDGSWTNDEKVTVSGSVSGLGTLKVWVNNKAAAVADDSFSLPVALVEGKNKISVRVQDERGQIANSSLTVWRDTIAPKIVITEPKDQFISNSTSLTVTGAVTDAFPACVTVNGITAGITGDKFDADITLAEGWNIVTVKAWDGAGNVTQKSIKVLVDTVPPELFEVTAVPADWTSNTRPILTFGTTDATSGVSHYLASIDGGGFTKVTSPYQIPEQADGEHTIIIKAVDKAGWETENSVKVYIDTKPPVKVSEFKAVPGDKKIIVSWKENPEEDVVKYILKRIPAFPDGSEQEFEIGITEYIDTEVEDLKSYTYSIRAIDHANNGSPVVTAPAVKPGMAEIVINPSLETKIEYENVLVGIPIGALPVSRTITITKVKNPERILEESKGINLSPVYCLSAATPQGPVDPAGVQFAKPVLVGIKYELEGMYQYLKESSFRAFYYNSNANNWEMIPESYVDSENKVLYFFTKHFSMFTVQASTAQSMSPEQISNMGVSPGKAYYQNNQVSISYSSGSASVTAKDFVLPGKGGLDLTISRSYDSGLAQSDWGIDEENMFSALNGFLDTGAGNWNAFVSFLSGLVAREIDKYLAEPSGAYGLGRGWRMNFVWVEKNENGQFVHLPGGGMKKINWTIKPGSNGQRKGVFECHAGEHFILEQTQIKEGDLYSTAESREEPVKVGETWTATSYVLTTKDGTKYYLDGFGKLQRIVNRLGNSEIDFTYRSDGKLDYIIDSVGRKIQFTYEGNFIRTITGAGRTVTYSYGNDELISVNDAGLQTTSYGYERFELKSGYQSFSLTSFLNFFTPAGPLGFFLSVAQGLIPHERTDEVYYLTSVTTPFEGQYRMEYTKYSAMQYSSDLLTVAVAWYQFGKATRFQEIGSAYSKDMRIDYQIAYTNDQAPTVSVCDVYEGSKRTHMLFDRYSNSVDKDTTHLKLQIIYGDQDRAISSHLVEEFDYELEAPKKVIDQTGGRGTVTEFKYDNWGNVIWQNNSHTKVEAFYTYANTNAPPIDNGQAKASPYGAQTLDGNIHDAKTGELILNYNGDTCIPQQALYKYETNGNLSEKAIRHDNVWLKTTYQYDSIGNITKMTSPSGIETDYEYSATYQQALLTKVSLSKLTDADGQVKTNVVLKELGYDPETFRKRWEKDARGYVTEYQYDIIGRETMTVLPDDNDPLDYRPGDGGGPIDRSGSRSDNPVQQLTYKDADQTTTVIDPMGNRTDYIYDSFEHLMEIIKFKKTLGVPYAYSRVKVRYDDQGNIHEIISPEGCKNPDQEFKYKTKYLYDEANRLSKIIYPDFTEDQLDNPFKYYSYNDVTNEVTVTDENGYETVIKKDPVDRVIEQIAGYRTDVPVTTKFSYDALGNKVSGTDGKGNLTLYEYDDQNRLVRKTLPPVEVLNDPNGSSRVKSPVASYEYDNEGNLVREISSLGTIIKHYYDEMNREIKTETSFTGLDGTKKTVISKTFYDLAGNKVKTVDSQGKATEFAYSARGWMKEQKDPMGGIIRFTYDAVGNKLSETDPRGNAAGAAANSYTAWYYYDELYRVVKAVLPDNSPPQNPANPGDNPVVSFDYDLNGNCTKETKANGQAINYTYNSRNWLLTQSQSLNGQDYTTRFEYDGIGNKRFVYDNKGNGTEYRYDALSRLALQISPEGNTVSYDYDENGNRTAVRDGKHNETKYEYDALNRLQKVIDADLKATTNWYNEEGRLTKTVSPTGLVTKFHVNELGMPLRVIDSLGQTRSFDYDISGNTIYNKDPRGTETRFEYDDLYRVLRTDLQNGTRQQYLSYEYDPVGNIKQTDNGQVRLIYNNADTSYESDPFNRIKKVAQVMPGGTTYNSEYRYDNKTGNMTGIKYPNSQAWLNYDYDKMNRLVGIPGFAGSGNNLGFTYDENSALQTVKTDNGVQTTYQRDKNGRITNIGATKSGNNILALHYEYDNANNIILRNDNVYVYDKLNRLQRATIYGAFEDKFTKADLLMGTVDQDYHGSKEIEEDVTDQTQVKLDFAARSLILDLQTDADNISKVELIPEVMGHRVPVEQIEVYYRHSFMFVKLDRSKWAGTKDANGRITIKFTPLLETGEVKIHCNYEDLNMFQLPVDRSEFYNHPEKLVTVYQKFASRTESYEYDAGGNRTVERILLRKEYGWSYTYYPNSNWLKSKVKQDGTERIDYAYDANGNLISKIETKGDKIDTWEYAFDLLNQLEQVKKNGEVVSSYVYDPNGFRVEKNGSKGKIHYVPLLNGEVGYRKEFTSGKEYSWVYVGGQKLARVNGTIGSLAKKYFYQNDHLGSCLAMTDENGNPVVSRDFAPFGQRINTDVYDDEPKDPEETEDGFTGKDLDEDIGLYYYNARWYDPEIGRFISQDSVSDPANPNEFAYCGNNPVNNVDPSGHIGLNITGGLMNLASMYIPGFSAFMQGFNTFNLFVNCKGNIVNMILGNFDINYAGTANTGMQDRDGEIGYQETGKHVFKHFKLVKTERNQTFENQNGDTISVKTVTSGGQTSQEYTITKADGTTSTQTVNYVADIPDQKNQVAAEGFISNDEAGMEAIKLVVTRNGVEAAFQGSTLPQGGYRDADGNYKTTGENKVAAEGTYGMYSWSHSGGTWQYDNAIQLGDDALYSSIPAEYSGIFTTNANGEQVPVMTATGVNDHASQRNGRSSSACQNTAAFANWFSIGPNGPQQHAGVPVNQRRNPDKGFVSHADINRYWPTWAAWSDIMVPHTATKAATTGQFIGYYYLNRL